MKRLVVFLPVFLFISVGCQDEDRMRSIAAEVAEQVLAEQTRVESVNLTKPLGPYSTAKRVGGFLFVSGQVGVDPTTGQLVEGFEAETRQVMENIRRVLESTGYNFSDVVNSTVYLKNINDYAVMNTVYGSYFADDTYPSRVTVEVSDLPARARIEISVVAHKQKG